MQAPDEHQEQPTRIVETAAGTTSPDNANSGGGAYLIAAVTICLLLALGMGLRGFMHLVGDLVGDSWDETSSQHHYLDDYDEYDEDEDLFDLDLDELLDGWEGDEDVVDELGGSHGGLSTGTTVVEVLGSDLAAYSYTIDARLPASAYANAQRPVQEFVRDLVLKDKDGSDRLCALLRKAAWDTGEVDEALKEADKLAADTADELRALEFPQVAGPQASDVSHDLEVGRTKAIARWEAIRAQIALLLDDDIGSAALERSEADIEAAADDAAERLASALKASQQR